jgi:hypothetical protein
MRPYLRLQSVLTGAEIMEIIHSLRIFESMRQAFSTLPKVFSGEALF